MEDWINAVERGTYVCAFFVTRRTGDQPAIPI
jgi:hypothetical protein